MASQKPEGHPCRGVGGRDDRASGKAPPEDFFAASVPKRNVTFPPGAAPRIGGRDLSDTGAGCERCEGIDRVCRPASDRGTGPTPPSGLPNSAACQIDRSEPAPHPRVAGGIVRSPLAARFARLCPSRARMRSMTGPISGDRDLPAWTEAGPKQRQPCTKKDPSSTNQPVSHRVDSRVKEGSGGALPPGGQPGQRTFPVRRGLSKTAPQTEQDRLFLHPVSATPRWHSLAKCASGVRRCMPLRAIPKSISTSSAVRNTLWNRKPESLVATTRSSRTGGNSANPPAVGPGVAGTE